MTHTAESVETLTSHGLVLLPRVRLLDAHDLAKWDEVVTGFQNHKTFHRRDWVHSLAETTGGRPLLLVVEAAHRIVACLPGLLLSIGPIRIFGSPLEGWQTASMGPLIDHERIAPSTAISLLVAFLENELRVHYMEFTSRDLDWETMETAGFEGRSLFTYISTLHPDNPRRTFEQFHSKTRTQYRRAVRSGLRVSMAQDESFVEDFYRHLQGVFRRHKIAVPFSRQRALSCLCATRAMSQLLCLRVYLPDADECIASAIYVYHADEITLWGWAHDSRYGSLCPIELLTWTAMEHAIERGCTRFDFGGGNSAKAKFGCAGDSANTRWIRTRYPLLLRLRDVARSAFKLRQRVVGKLQRWLNERSGPGQGQE